MEPVTSLRADGGLLELKPWLKRPESALQPAAPIPINEMATSCGQMADRRDAHMVIHSHATKDERINNIAVNRALSVEGFFSLGR
jgi:hypothetical protein